VIYPQQPDTVVMAILCCQQNPPPTTVRDCLELYYRLKLQEIEETGRQVTDAFVQRLTMLEDELLQSLEQGYNREQRPPVNSECGEPN
jgi:hypothetical protein